MDTQRTHRPRFDLSRILVIDLEATCWQGPPPPGEEHEVIEIGNAVLHVADLHVEPGPEILVRPTRSSVSPFCTELTTLTQGMLDERGVPFADAIAVLEAAHGGLRAVVWASYGNYDRRMLLAECERHGIDFPISDTHLNVKRLVALIGGWTRETGMLRAMRRLKLGASEGQIPTRCTKVNIGVAGSPTDSGVLTPVRLVGISKSSGSPRRTIVRTCWFTRHFRFRRPPRKHLQWPQNAA